jgi:hypothetical protein
MRHYQFKKGTLVRFKKTKTLAVVLKEPQEKDFEVLIHIMDKNKRMVKTRPAPMDCFELIAEGNG